MKNKNSCNPPCKKGYECEKGVCKIKQEKTTSFDESLKAPDPGLINCPSCYGCSSIGLRGKNYNVCQCYCGYTLDTSSGNCKYSGCPHDPSTQCTDTGSCLCPEGFNLNTNGGCECPDPTKPLIDGVCGCPSNATVSSDKTTCICDKPTTAFINGACTCPSGTYLNSNNQCVCIAPNMQKQIDSQGNFIGCYCPEGSDLFGNSCICSSGVPCNSFAVGGCPSEYPNCSSNGITDGCCY